MGTQSQPWSSGINTPMHSHNAWSTTAGSRPIIRVSFSFSHHLNHGALDQYGLFPASMPPDFSSEVNIGDSYSTFSDQMFPPNGFRGFTHHSNDAGDLILVRIPPPASIIELLIVWIWIWAWVRWARVGFGVRIVGDGTDGG